MTHSPTRVGVLHDGPLSDEQDAALAWLEERLPAEAMSFSALETPVERFDVLWYHRSAPVESEPLAERAPAVEAFLEDGGGLLLTLRAMAAVDALGVESVAPEAVGEGMAEPTGVLWRSLYDDHPAVASVDSLRLPTCDRGSIGVARYDSVLPSAGEVLASTVRGDREHPSEMTVVGWNAGAGSVLGVGAPVPFDESIPEEFAANRDRVIAGCLESLAGDDGQPRAPRSAGEMRALRERAGDDAHRPDYHFTPPANWLNDPNGLIAWNGRYHAFYQYNPAGPFHDTIHWGHATSDDLLHWEDEPVALSPSPEGPDRDGCWSGCAIDDGGTPTLLYTGGRGRKQLPCLATTTDPDLRRWEKYDGNPVIAEPPEDLALLETDHWEAEFRDHCVWREGDRWHQLIGTGLADGGGAVLRYSSENLREWRYEGPFLVDEGGSEGTVWECPELLDFGDYKLLHVSNYDEVVYFIGEARDGRFEIERRGVLDGGDFYAPQSLQDGDRHVTFGWLPEARDVGAQWDAGWSGALSLPRVLSVGPDGRLRQRPAEAVERLRDRRVADGESFSLSAGERRPLSAAGRSLEIDLEVALEDAEAFELSVLEGGRDERTAIRYTGEEVVVDRGASADHPPEPTTRRMAVPPYDEPLSLRAFVDGSVLELYANERHCLTSRVYPSEDATGVSARAEGGRASVRSLSAWTMERAVGPGRDDERATTR
ncbi:GH32 C-terminal domain-containing protein [Saliphagus sp. LR7]|uniref:GH32 C-terminal domain-containing protein n=1 Tax=Saliphagus sp. LR7 TaxID=2282654 RepID=UPI000DF7DDDC|nr:GH32 C-terminal domain-containing protein [Saliphagus sp. LR7]